jgi:hypothetical protein
MANLRTTKPDPEISDFIFLVVIIDGAVITPIMGRTFKI